MDSDRRSGRAGLPSRAATRSSTSKYFLFFLRACRNASRRTLAMWALASSAALMSHHFAAFLVAAEAVWLLVALSQRMGRVVAAVAAVGLVGSLGGALALEQRSQGLSA